MRRNGPPRKNSVHFRNVEFHRFVISNERINLTFFVKRLGISESTLVVRSVSVSARHGTLSGLVLLYLGIRRFGESGVTVFYVAMDIIPWPDRLGHLGAQYH